MRLWFFTTIAILLVLTASSTAFFDIGFRRQPLQGQLPLSPVQQRPSTEPLPANPTLVPDANARIEVVPQEAGAGPGSGGAEKPAMMTAVMIVGVVGVGFGLGMGL